MENKVYKSIIIVCLIAFFIALGRSVCLQHRLAETGRQLDNARVELAMAQNRQYELATILRRDSEILSESATTIAGIRSQIAVIRESYEEMEKLLYSDFLSSRSGRGSDLPDNKEIVE